MSTEAEALGERIAEMAAHLDAATHRLLTDLRDYDRSSNWNTQGFRTCHDWLSWRVGWSLGTARDHLRVAQRLGNLPLIDDALRKGEVSYSKVRAMTRVATAANEAMLLEDARHATGQQLELICRKYATVVRAAKEVDEDSDRQRRTVSRRDLEDGMVRIEATLHPEEAALVWAALDRIAKERAMRAQLAAQMGIELDASRSPVSSQDSTASPEATVVAAPRGAFSRADAFVAMAQSVVRGDAPQRSPVELVVTVAADVLHSSAAPACVSAEAGQGLCAGSFGVSAETPETTSPHALIAGLVSVRTPQTPIAVFADGTCVSAETVRRLACDCGVVHMTEDASGTPLSVGRKTRSIPGAIKKALLKRDRCCRFPGCSNRLYVEGHHLEHWADGGETALHNLLGLCSFHHRFVHEYGYRVELDDAQRPRFFDRDGREVQEVPDPPKPAGLGWSTIADLNDELEIGAYTSACLWDGDRPQYGDIIDALVRVEGLD